MVDETARRLYQWEDNCVEPKVRDTQRLLTRDQCREYVAMACTLSNTRVPNIYFKKQTHVPCKADFRKWELTLAEWGHSALPVLHEAAHFATFRAVMQGENGHGPSFARMAIEFYHHFMGIDKGYLITSAQRYGVHVSEISPSFSLSRHFQSPFSDIEF
jgi:hypothetical protein